MSIIRCAFVLAMFFACPAAAQLSSGINLDLTVEHDGETRIYDLFVPANSSGALPLIVDMHGFGFNRNEQRDFSGFDVVAASEGLLVAYPQGIGNAWNDGALASTADDVGFIKALVDDVAARATVDASRVYATGWSNGGSMTYRLACEATDTFAAFVSVASTVEAGTTPADSCGASRAFPILSFRGDTDQFNPIQGGFDILRGRERASAEEEFQYWRNANSCPGGPPDETVDHGPTSSCQTYTHCANGVHVGLCVVRGTDDFNGHLLYSNVDNLNIAALVWDFMSQFELTQGQSFELNAGLNDAWFNPATDGQGFFITVYEDISFMFVAWFTYDTERPPEDVTAMLGEPGHRWITGQGLFEGDTATLDVVISEGGIFDSGQPLVSNETDGTMIVEFSDCENGLVTYNIESLDLQGVVPIQRIALDNVPACEALASR